MSGIEKHTPRVLGKVKAVCRVLLVSPVRNTHTHTHHAHAHTHARIGTRTHRHTHASAHARIGTDACNGRVVRGVDEVVREGLRHVLIDLIVGRIPQRVFVSAQILNQLRR